MQRERLENEATEIGRVTVNGQTIVFYEDPDHGDETGMWAVACGDFHNPDHRGEVVKTDWRDIPTPEEVDDACEFMTCYRR